VTNPWKDAIDNELVVAHLGVAGDDPRADLNKLINWHCAVALDPAVSSDAAALIERGRQLEREEIAQMFDEEQKRRQYLDNYAGCAARCIRARVTPPPAQQPETDLAG
jgi:hypothetical protein